MSASLIHAAPRQQEGQFRDGDVLHVVSKTDNLTTSLAKDYVESLLRESGADIGLEAFDARWAGPGHYRSDVYNVTLRLKPNACKHCLKPEDWHDESDGACPDDDAPHPNSSAALSVEEEVKARGIDADAATVRDVALDIVAILDREAAAFGSGETTIVSVNVDTDDYRDILIRLDNAQTFRVRVEELDA